MISAGLYETIYYIFVTVMSLILYHSYGNYRESRLESNATLGSQKSAVIVTVLIILFIGLRPLSGVFVDMMNYNATYTLRFGNLFNFSLDTNNFIFDNLFRYMYASKIPIEWFFLLIATIYFGCMYWGLRIMFPNDTLYAFIAYLAAFSTFGYATNGIKAGAAASIFILALALWKSKPKWSIFTMIVSLGFHHSMTLCLGAFVLACLIKKPNRAVMIWVICLFIAILHITWFQNLFAQWGDEGANTYLNTENINQWGGKLGFRPDFVIYSFLPLWLGYINLRKISFKDKYYCLIFNTYAISNSIWLLCMYANYTNRIAYLSWLMIPVILVYPYLKMKLRGNQYKILNYVAGAQLAFTLFMEIIYYG